MQFFSNLPFGETMAEQMTGAYDNPYKFNAKQLDAETGFYYYGARYYNPKWSQWYGVDPLAEKMPSWSPYAYCGNNPINYIDPDGNFRLPANATKEQRRLYTEAIKTIKAVFRDSGFREAFKDRFKVDDKMIQKMLKDGDGPTVVMNESMGHLGLFNQKKDPNAIYIDPGVINTVSKHKGDRKYIDNLAEIIIHEGGHWADYKMDGKSQEFTPGFRTSFQSKSGMPDAGDNWEIIYFGTDTQFSASDRDIITEKFDGFRRNNAAKDFRQQREIRDLKSQKKSSILDIYKKPKDNLRVRPCY
ncbi:RHS repeat-associated core domain-containing protein [Chryseobacterium sp. JJR-5R]|uniref:RHS repeat-associated core domain-containing protein n=1 Tax=Chryseobacterium sp. JJR-5R TaxID=3093923 RepID=UPI002A747CB2|nr:RHS repeat-associated core domain-containing protein [Chryseobacterium sp. JJR-5R]WPO81575.1 RHS repeat-associated core domain-containing protein [Chryseobacterium sp. JJR-5R]